MSLAPPDPDRQGVLAVAGAGAALVSLALPYATLSGVGREVSVAASLDPRSPLFVFAVLVVTGAGLSVLNYTWGEQLLGALFALVLLTTVLGPLVVMDLSGYPEPGLVVLLVGWLAVDAADDLDPELSNPRTGRWLPLSGLGILALSGSAFLLLHRLVVTTEATTAVTVAWLLSGVVALGAWIVTAAWEWTAERA